MTDRGNIKLPREDYERHNERRKELGLTWSEYIDGEAPDAGWLESSLSTIEERTGRIEKALEDMGMGR